MVVKEIISVRGDGVGDSDVFFHRLFYLFLEIFFSVYGFYII